MKETSPTVDRRRLLENLKARTRHLRMRPGMHI